MTAAPFTSEILDDMSSVDDMPANFKEIDLKTAKTWTLDSSADPQIMTHLIYGISGNMLKYVDFHEGQYH